MLIQLWAICPRLADNCYIYLPFNKTLWIYCYIRPTGIIDLSLKLFVLKAAFALATPQIKTNTTWSALSLCKVTPPLSSWTVAYRFGMSRRITHSCPDTWTAGRGNCVFMLWAHKKNRWLVKHSSHDECTVIMLTLHISFN